MYLNKLKWVGIGAALLSAYAMPALANSITTAVATISCGPPATYTAGFTGVNLEPNDLYEVDFSITSTPKPSGTPITVTGSVPIPADTAGNFSVSATGAVGLGKGIRYEFTGTATLVDLTTGKNRNTIPISFTNEDHETTCSQRNCVQQSAIPANFNGTPIFAGSFIWFNSNFTATGIPSKGATISFTNSTVSLNNTSYPVPNAQISFVPGAGCASTTFDTLTNTWITTVPLAGSDEIFLSGLALPVPATLTHVTNPVVWDGTISTVTPGVSLHWKWGAAVYSNFTTDYNSLDVKPTHSQACSFNNGDHAGTPENSQVKALVIGGATGGGGANFTGSWSGTFNVVPICTRSRQGQN